MRDKNQLQFPFRPAPREMPVEANPMQMSLRPRRVDFDLAERIEASGRPSKPQSAARKGKAPRKAITYRGARRNVARAAGLLRWPREVRA